MARLRFLRTRRLPTRSYAKAFGISVGIHGALAAIVVLSFAGHSLIRSRDPQAGPIGSATRTGTGGIVSVAAPPTGPSLNPDSAARYVGRYSWSSGQAIHVFDVQLINDGETVHWSLAIAENQGTLRTLMPVARDTFAFQLAPEHKVLFRRVGGSVTSLTIRRGRDTSWAEREAVVRSPPNEEL